MLTFPTRAVLAHKPDGKGSSAYPLTVGNTYAVLGQMGSCVIVETDVKGETASIHPSRLTFAAPKP